MVNIGIKKKPFFSDAFGEIPTLRVHLGGREGEDRRRLGSSPPRGGDSSHLEGNDLEAGRIVLDAICEVSPRTRRMIDVQRVTLAQAGCVLCCRTGRQSGAAPGELRKTKLFTLPGSQSGRPHGKPPGWSGGRRVRGEPRTQPLLGSLPKRQGQGES